MPVPEVCDGLRQLRDFSDCKQLSIDASGKAMKHGWVRSASIATCTLVNKAGAGELRFGMPNPNYSGVGAAVVYAMHVGTFGREPDMMSVTSQAARAFGNGHLLSGPSAHWVAKAFLTKQDVLDGVFLPEPAIHKLVEAADLKEPVCVVWPEQAIPVATYTLALTNWANQDAFDKVSAYIAGEITQKTADAIVRPGNGGAVAIPEWGKSQILRLMVRSYLEMHMRKGVTVVLIDTSNGMAKKGRMEAVKAALTALANGDADGDRFSRFRNNEKLVLVSYSSNLNPTRELYIDRRADNPTAELLAYLDELKPGAEPGDVSSAIGEAYQIAREQYSNGQERRVNLVVIVALDDDTGASELQLAEWAMENSGGMPEVSIFIRPCT